MDGFLRPNMGKNHQSLSSTKNANNRKMDLFSSSRCRYSKRYGKLSRFPCRTFVSFENTHPFNGPFSGTTRVSRYQKGKTNLHFTEARDSEWQWHQLGHIQVCTSLQTDNHTSTPPLSFLQAGCPSCRPTNSVKALKAVPFPFENIRR